jgi:hypothetical protein
MNLQLRTLTMLAAFGVAAGLSRASTLELQFSGAAAGVFFNGVFFQADLTVDLFANTANLILGNGFLGSNQYTGLTAYVSSVDLGLSDVAATTPLSVEIGLFDAAAPLGNGTVLLYSNPAEFTGLIRIPQIATWNDTSSFGPFGSEFPFQSPVPMPLTLSDGDTLAIRNFWDGAGSSPATFEATIVVPEPGLAALLGVIVAVGVLLGRRQKT